MQLESIRLLTNGGAERSGHLSQFSQDRSAVVARSGAPIATDGLEGLVAIVGFPAAMRTQTPHEPLGENGFDGAGQLIRGDAHVQQSDDSTGDRSAVDGAD